VNIPELLALPQLHLSKGLVENGQMNVEENLGGIAESEKRTSVRQGAEPMGR
jgi:hypothetical protein